jgi:hypothetical protein
VDDDAPQAAVAWFLPGQIEHAKFSWLTDCIIEIALKSARDHEIAKYESIHAGASGTERIEGKLIQANWAGRAKWRA